MMFLKEVSEKGIVNMEMEALVFAALTHKAGIRSAVLCVTLLDRLHGDQVHQIVKYQGKENRRLEFLKKGLFGCELFTFRGLQLDLGNSIIILSSNHYVWWLQLQFLTKLFLLQLIERGVGGR